MVFAYYDQPPINQYYIANVARVSSEGTYTDEMLRASHFSNLSTSLGDDAPGYECTGYPTRPLGYSAFYNGFYDEATCLTQLKSLIDQNYPIAVLMWYSTSHIYTHGRVAIGYDDSGIIAHDPLDGCSIHYSNNLFKDLWSCFGRWALFTSPWSVSVNTPELVPANSTFEVDVNVTYLCPDPFDYWGVEYPADSCNATIQLPPGFLLAPGENQTKVLSETPFFSRESRNISWQVVTPQNASSHSISVSAEGIVHGSVKAHGSYPAYNYSDRIGGMNSSIVNVNNPPTSPTVDITPDLPLTNDDLVCTVTVPSADPEGDTITYVYEWYKDNISTQTTITIGLSDTLHFNSTAKGEVWKCVVTPFDGTENGTSSEDQVTIQNSPPSISSVEITPDPAYTNTDLTATPSGWSDPDNDPPSYSYQWQKWNGDNWQNISGATTNTLSSTNFAKEDQIKIICTPFDGTDYGTSKEDTITISNSAPTIDSFAPTDTTPEVNEGESQEFNITKFDLDGDPLTVTWWLNQTNAGETSNSYQYIADYESAGIYNITVTISDGFEHTSHQWILTVTSVERDIAITNIIPSKNIVDKGYCGTINLTIANQGEITETFNATVYANTTVIHVFTNVSLPSGNSVTVTFQWNTTSFLKGNYTISAYVAPVPGETDLSDNNSTDSWVFVTIQGDVDGDRDVDIYDVVKITGIYGSKRGDPQFNPNSDLDDDGEIKIYDVVRCTSHYGQSWQP